MSRVIAIEKVPVEQVVGAEVLLFVSVMPARVLTCLVKTMYPSSLASIVVGAAEARIGRSARAVVKRMSRSR